MKLIKSQNKQFIVSARHISLIEVGEQTDRCGSGTGDVDIDVHLGNESGDDVYTIATYRTKDEALRQMDRLATFLSSNANHGLHEM